MSRFPLACLTFLVACCTGVSAVTIDDFTEGAVTLFRDDAPVVATQSDLNPKHTLGGARQILLGEFGEPAQYLEIEGGNMTLGSFAPGLAYLRLQYGSESAPLELNLTAGGHDRFLFDDVYALGTSGVLRIGSSGGAQSVRSLNGLVEPPFLLYRDFSTGADFTSVSWIELYVVRSTGLSMGTIRTVPEPTATFAMFALFGAICFRWQRMRP